MRPRDRVFSTQTANNVVEVMYERRKFTPGHLRLHQDGGGIARGVIIGMVMQ